MPDLKLLSMIRAAIVLIALVVVCGFARAQSVPAGRAAKNIAVITIRDEIDKWTAFGIDRRIKRAVADGADAIVFDIDTPGGDLQACLKICNAIKSCPVSNTVAWINPNAYSAGAIIALACREIVTNEPATLGDALPIIGDPIFGVQAMPDAEREKFLGPLLSEVVDSARRNGQDEMLVQGLVRRGVELWLVEHTVTGERLFVTAEQYQRAVGEKPQRTTPQITSATGGSGKPLEVIKDPDAPPATTPGTGAVDEELVFEPAAPGMSKGLTREVNANLEIKGARSQRPDLTLPENEGKYRLVEYVSDGYGLVVLKSSAMVRYGVAQQVVRNDEELKAYFGAPSMARLDESWSEGLVRFLTNPIVRGVLIIILLISMFIEMTHPGVILPGFIAGLSLVALIVPPLLVDLAAWWGVAAILLGILCIGVEVLLIPGFGVIGIFGIILLFGGLVGVFVGGPTGLFPNSPKARNDLAFGALTVLVSMVTSLILMFFIGRHLPTLPIIKRLVLSGVPADDSTEGLLSAMAANVGAVRVGAVGRTLTPLRPSGRVQIGDQIVDVVAEMGFVDADVEVRVVAVERFRTVVERATV